MKDAGGNPKWMEADLNEAFYEHKMETYVPIIIKGDYAHMIKRDMPEKEFQSQYEQRPNPCENKDSMDEIYRKLKAIYLQVDNLAHDHYMRRKQGGPSAFLESELQTRIKWILRLLNKEG